MKTHYFLFLSCFFMLSFFSFGQNTPIPISLGGNAYVEGTFSREENKVTDKGIEKWTSAENTSFSIYFRNNVKGNMQIALEMDASSDCELEFRVSNKIFRKKIKQGNNQKINIGTINNVPIGYVKLQITGINKKGDYFPNIRKAYVSGTITAEPLNYVKDDFSFHFGRRGPSDHLKYSFGDNKDVEWFYNEVTVGEGNDIVGSYFMANGFKHGYFGMQVNSLTERRILFSVWSPFETDKPQEIPDSHKITLLRKGVNVKTGEFGNEGSGGQSYLVFNWKAGVTYKFLNRMRPIDEHHTLYTAYFFDPEQKEWLLIASFIRPQTNSWYSGAYSFLENFNPNQGQYTRKVYFDNQWARTATGKWFSVNEAIFKVDATAKAGARKEYKGGIDNGIFFLQNGGFFNDFTPPNTKLIRTTTGKQPVIDFNLLP